MKKMFTDEENGAIYVACNAIRASMTVYLAHAGVKNPGQGIGNMALKTGKGSLINALIQQNDWINLFLNEHWLDVLERAQNLSILQNDSHKKYLDVIVKFFPEETKAHLTR